MSGPTTALMLFIAWLVGVVTGVVLVGYVLDRDR